VTYEIRDLEQAADMAALEDLQIGAWGFPEREVLPSSMFKISAHSGGVRRGGPIRASEPRPVGYVYGFPALRGRRARPPLPPARVLPEHRGSGLAVRLKLPTQRASGPSGSAHRLATWTMDPLLARNARLNLGKLGARAVSYHPDWYVMRGGIYAGLPADASCSSGNSSPSPGSARSCRRWGEALEARA
jgi:predicted GNAT superfamily acetyltransferase